MADLRFSVPTPQDFDPRVWETAYVTGIEGIPWHCTHTLKDDLFSIGREIDESGKLHIVWPSRSLGNVCLSTTSLRVSDHVYSLPVELARGTVSRLKHQTAEWQRVGLKLPGDYFSLADQSLTALLHALTAEPHSHQQVASAQESIDLALRAAVQLCESFSTQALEARQNSEGKLATLLGCQLETTADLKRLEQPFQSAFNLIGVTSGFGQVESTGGRQQFDLFDRQVSWATKHQHKLCIGPLVDFRDGRLPDWMMLLDDGFESLHEAACQHVQRTVERFRGKAQLWNCATGLNGPNRLGWSDEQILRVAVSLIETARKADERSPVLLTIDQPWSEYLRDDAHGISPLHFADALIRADLGLSGLALELNLDIWPGGSMQRDPIEINRLVDRWSMLGLPLMIILSSPTDGGRSAAAQRICGWRTPQASGVLAAESIVSLLLAKPSVHAILWQGLRESDQGDHPGMNLWDASGTANSLLPELAQLKRTFLH